MIYELLTIVVDGKKTYQLIQRDNAYQPPREIKSARYKTPGAVLVEIKKYFVGPVNR